MSRALSQAAIAIAPEVYSGERLAQDDRRGMTLTNAGIGLWQLSVSTNELDCDQTTAQLLRYADQSTLSDLNDLLKLVYPEDQRDVSLRLELCARVGASMTCSFRLAQRGKGEDSCWLELTASRTQSADCGPIVTGTLRDITPTKRVEEALQDSESRLAIVFEQTMVGVMHTDRDRNILMVNDRYLELVGRTQEELTGLSFEAYTHPDDLDWNVSLFIAKGPSGEPFTVEKRYVRPDGSIIWCEVSVTFVLGLDGAWNSSIIFAHDITERKLAEDELRENEERLRFTQEAGQIGTFFVDSKGMVHGSKQYFRNLGLPDDTETIDHGTWQSLFHPDDLERVEQEISDAEKSGTTFYESEHRIFRADSGEVRWILARVSPERNADGHLLIIAGAHIDITEAKSAAQMLRASENLNEQIVESSTDCIKILDPDGTLRFISQRGLDALEIDDSITVLGKGWPDLWPKEARSKVMAALARARQDKVGRFNAGCATAKGISKWWDVIITPLKNEAGAVTQLLCISRDVTDLRKNSEKIRWAAEHDTLTNIPNRNYFESQLEIILEKAEKTGENVGLLALDVDNFKQVNDAFGHATGDALLQTLARRLQGLVEGDDFAARLGGDEFAIVLRHLEDGRDLLEIGRAIMDKMKEPIAHQGYILDCRVSIGAATCPEHGNDRSELLKSADTALYAAKTAGRNSILLYDSAFRSELDRRKRMIDMAREALDRDGILPFYQPKICLRTGKVEGFEALLRWRDQCGDVHFPGEIEAVFEDLELAHEISERMQDCILRDMRCWLDAGIDFGHVAINAAAAEFSRNDFAARLLSKLDAAGVPATKLQVEVTETVFVGRGADHVASALLMLKARGVEIALDDFGTGYASLSHLKRFPVDVIKIDRSFIADLGEDAGGTAIVCALLSLSADLNMKIVAEGIETEAQAAFLKERGCDLGQGYLFGKAVSAEQAFAQIGIEMWDLPSRVTSK